MKWGLGIGDWGLGIEEWDLAPINKIQLIIAHYDYI